MRQFMLEVRPDVAVVVTLDDDGRVQVSGDERVLDAELLRIRAAVQESFDKGRIRLMDGTEGLVMGSTGNEP